jgi:large subunit ribosomal protein L23
MMAGAGEILKRVHLTEKLNFLSTSCNQYVFEVAVDANRRQVMNAIQRTFGIKPLAVNVLRQKGKLKRCRTSRRSTIQIRKPEIKKAYVTLRKEDKIEVM